MTSSPSLYRETHAAEAFKRGVEAQLKGDLALAVKEWRYALACMPRHLPALYNVAVAEAMQGETEAAAGHYQDLLAIDPDHKDALFNLANLKKRQGQDDAARLLFKRLVETHPSFASGFVNFAKLCSDQGEIEEAETLLLRAIEIDPTHVIAHWNFAHLLLRSGRWKEGWRCYEWRLKIPGWMKPPCPAPAWSPSAQKGRVLLWNDQGRGDAIQFLRYPRLLAAQGWEVYLLLQEELCGLAASAPGVSRVFSPREALPEVEAQAPLLSLPYRLGLEGPQDGGRVPYLASNRMEIPRRKALTVGVVWAGNRTFSNDASRSLPLSALAPLFDREEIDWISLQYGADAKQIEENNLSRKIVDLSPRLRTFSDTAAAVAAVDLVICVDTAVAHVAGALGQPCWVMLPSRPDWRFAEDEKARLWYPSLRFFRQTQAHNGLDVVERLDAALREYLTNRER
ncbi:MAG: tetratricopeptide repeat protein [Alphaproteobacteria bacterium]|nr:tetratricopeptide repeat protein [Alphaproteobacteria bacterium]